MNKNIENILEESIKTETLAAELYETYAAVFSDDKDFWSTLKEEELNHAALLRSARFFLKMDMLPEALLMYNIENIISNNVILEDFIARMKSEDISKKEAYNFALETENSVQEMHFQFIMDHATDSKIIETFQKLNKDDKDHYTRIVDHIKKIGL